MAENVSTLYCDAQASRGPEALSTWHRVGQEYSSLLMTMVPGMAKSFLSLRVAACLVCLSCCLFAQNPDFRTKPLTIELLTMEGSNSGLEPNGEGISAVQSTLLFKLGGTHVSKIGPGSSIALPVGYTLFNDLVYKIETKAVVTGPHAIVFQLPLVRTKELFDRLRILHGDLDDAEPDMLRWSDVTVLADDFPRLELRFTKPQFEGLVPNFEKRTLRGISEELGTFVVALKDSAVSRDRFVADVGAEASSVPESVMEGREIRYSYKITNNGPDTATSVRFHSFVHAEYISFETSQGTCRSGGGNIYCNLGQIAKGAAVTVSVNARSTWGIGDQTPSIGVEYEVWGAEQDSNYENNMRMLDTPVLRDPNKAPIVDLITPSQGQFFVGPDADITIVVNAHDPDGSINQVEVFNEAKSIGMAKLIGDNRYELKYSNVGYGNHSVTAIATDNLGRPERAQTATFFVNGHANLEIVSPRANQVLRMSSNLLVTVRASDLSRQIKSVTISLFGESGPNLTQIASPTGVKNEYAATFPVLMPGFYSMYAIADDDADVPTMLAPFQFRIAGQPHTTLQYTDGQTSRDFAAGAVFSASATLDLFAQASAATRSPGIVKIEIYANEQLICANVKDGKDIWPVQGFRSVQCPWTPRPGRYKLVAVGTDGDGEIGKSTPVEIVIQ